MSLESGSYINDLVITNPPGSDPKSQMDDHLRLIKTVLKETICGFTGTTIVTGTDGGAADAYTLTPTTTLLAYSTKMLVEFTPNATNATTTPTLNISALGAVIIKSVAGAALVALDLPINVPVLCVYNGTNFVLLGPTKNYIDQLALSAALPAQVLGLLISTGSVASFSKSLGFGLNEAKAADVASASAPDIWSGNGNTMHITGTVTLTGFAAAPQAGAWRKLYFDGACLLTNSANFNVQGAMNYTTSAGDTVLVYADTTTKFYLYIMKANGDPTLSRNQTLLCTSTLTKTTDTTLATIPGFTATLVSNGTYKFSIVAFTTATDTGSSGGGVKFGFAGTATATSFVAAAQTARSLSYVLSRVTSLASTLGDDQVTGVVTTIQGTIICNAGGTFIIQFAQSTSGSTASSVLINSTFSVDRIS